MSRPSDLLRLADVYWHYAVSRKDHCRYPPYRLWVEPTSLCNLRCPMCPNKSLDESHRGLMEMDLFRDIIDQAAGFVHDINIHHRGESLLHPRLAEMIATAADRNIMVKLHTNATLLDEGKSRRLIQSGLGLISFSFDGLDAETYERYRKGADFGKTVENILRFLEIKKELGSTSPVTIFEMMDLTEVDQRYSLAGLAVFRRQFDDLPLDRFVVKKPHNFGGSVRLSPDGDSSLRPLTPCTFPWHSLVIFWDGRVVPCPQDFFGQLEVGNAREGRLRDLFNAPRMVSLRRNMLRREVSEEDPCARCDLIRRPTILGIPTQSLKFLRR